MNALENFIAKCEINGKSDSDLISRAVDESRKQQLKILDFKGSHIWEGNLEDMRSL